MRQATFLLQGVHTVDGQEYDVRIDGERIGALTPPGEYPAVGLNSTSAVSGKGLLMLPAFVDLHIHLDKAFLKDELPETDGTLESAIRLFRERKARFTPEDVAARAARLIRSSVVSGATRIRTHVDIDRWARLVGLEGVRRAAEECADLCDVQIVAFPQEGIIEDPEARHLMERAVDIGAHLVGGMPHWESDPRAQQSHVDFCFALAREADRDVDMHVDETDDGAIRTLEMVADAAMAYGWEGRVTVGHVCSLAAADDAYADRVIRKCRDAGLTVVANPGTNLTLQGRRDRGLIRRGLTRVGEFRAAGVNLCFGQDNVADGFYPFGRGDMLEIAFLAAHAGHLTGGADLPFVLETVTGAPARAWGEPGYGISEGTRADLLLFRSNRWEDVLREQQPPYLVFARGRPVAKTMVSTEVGVHVCA